MSNQKQIVKNTIFLYLRMILSMGVSLYTSRVILNILGIADYGIYNVVGGIIVMFSFINNAMSGTSSRFITYELGLEKGNVQRIFSATLTIHLAIAIFILLLGETIGVWFLNNKLVIPENRMTDAMWLYQFTVISSFFTITQVPYNSSIIAHERMNVYAYVEIVNVCLKLCIVLSLKLLVKNRLIIYGFMIMLASILIMSIYRWYCMKEFKHCKFSLCFNKSVILPILKFSGWDSYAMVGIIGRTQGIGLILNIFFTATINAATGIALQVQTAVMSLTNNITTAFRPQIIKQYASSNPFESCKLIIISAFFTSLILLMISMPLIIFMPVVLKIWLNLVPNYAVEFCRLVLIFCFINNLVNVVMIGVHTYGKNKFTSIIIGTIDIFILPATYILFKFKLNPLIPYMLVIITEFIILISCVLILNHYIKEFSIGIFLKKVILRLLIIVSCTGIPILYISSYLTHNLWGLLELVALVIFTLCASTYLLLSQNERNKINYILKNIKKKA